MARHESRCALKIRGAVSLGLTRLYPNSFNFLSGQLLEVGIFSESCTVLSAKTLLARFYCTMPNIYTQQMFFCFFVFFMEEDRLACWCDHTLRNTSSTNTACEQQLLFPKVAKYWKNSPACELFKSVHNQVNHLTKAKCVVMILTIKLECNHDSVIPLIQSLNVLVSFHHVG